MTTLEEIKTLRETTGAGINAVKEALEVSKGDVEKAMKYLREKGLAKLDKRKEKKALNGILGVYVHGNNRVVCVVEVACETDFAAKSEDMKKFANDLAVHVTAANPTFISSDSIPAEEMKKVTEMFKKEVEGKPANIQESILKGKLEKFYAEAVLMNQNLFQDDSKTVSDYLNELIAKIGEKIVVRKFYKFEVTQDVSSCSID